LEKRLGNPGKLFDCTLVTILTYDGKITILKKNKSSHLGIRKTVELPNAVKGFDPDSMLKIRKS
jgi:hypothetical protein